MKRDRRLLARMGTLVSALGLLIGVGAPLVAGLSSDAASASSCDSAHVLTAFHFTINGVVSPTLKGRVHQGDTVEAFFTVAAGCRRVPVDLVSHTSLDPVFVPSHASAQRVYDAARGVFDGGDHTLGPIAVPPCNFQIDFAVPKHVIPGFLYSSAVGGTNSCVSAPQVTIVTTCVASTGAPSGGVSITYDNTRSQRTDTFTLTSTIGITDTVVVVHGQTVTKVYPMAEGQTGTFTVTDDMTPTPFTTTVTVTHDCAAAPPPAVTSCSPSGALTVTLQPTTPAETRTYTVVVTANGQTTTETVTVSATQITRSYAVPEDSTGVSVTVKDSTGATVLSQALTHDCAHPTASVVASCAVAGTSGPSGALVSATNEGSRPKTFAVRKNGTTVDHLTVAPFSTATTVEVMSQGETATFTVTGPEGLTTGAVAITRFCAQVLPVVVTTPGSGSPGVVTPSAPGAAGSATSPVATLPRTGSSTGPLLLLALGLMGLGATMLLASRGTASRGTVPTA